MPELLAPLQPPVESLDLRFDRAAGRRQSFAAIPRVVQFVGRVGQVDSGALLALRTRGELGLLVGRVRQRVGGDRGGDSLSDRVRGAFDLGEREPLRVGDGMRVRPAEDRQNLASDAAEFVVGELGGCSS